MKKFAYIILSVVVGSVVASSSAIAQAKKDAGTSKATDTAATGKITKNEAQHLVLKRYPGANIISCDESTVNGKAVWIVKYTAVDGNLANKIQVDAQTGQLTRM